VGQAGTLTALVLGEANQFRWKKSYAAGFLILDEFNQPVKMSRICWSQPQALLFSVSNSVRWKIPLCGGEASLGLAFMLSLLC